MARFRLTPAHQHQPISPPNDITQALQFFSDLAPLVVLDPQPLPVFLDDLVPITVLPDDERIGENTLPESVTTSSDIHAVAVVVTHMHDPDLFHDPISFLQIDNGDGSPGKWPVVKVEIVEWSGGGGAEKISLKPF